jgi:periplasmic protein TonB
VDEERKQRKNRYLPIAIGSGLVLAVVGGMLWWILSIEKKSDGPKRQTAQVIKIVRPPPPPEQPPPPPPPEKVNEPIPQDTPEPTPQDEAPAEQLGVDADGTAGGDGFGLAARKGGRDLLASGAGAFAWYTGMLKDSILETLSDDQRVRKGSYAAVVRIWLASDGRVEKVKLAQSTGDRVRDSAIEEALGKLSRVREAPPIEMPQPVTLRIVSRG